MTPKISDILGIINKIAPPILAEEWDNVGLMVGDPACAVSRVMVALDGTREAVDAAIAAGCRLLLTHHPFLFRPLKRITANDPTGTTVLQAISGGLAVISLHTNYDIAAGGMNDLLAQRLGMCSAQPLSVTATGELVKLAVFVPAGHEEQVSEALFRFSGTIGTYRDCSFQSGGTGTFRPLEGARPFLGTIGVRAQVAETRIEVLVRKEMVSSAVTALLKAHPYEEPAFDLYPLLNRGATQGLGRIGYLAEETTLALFADAVKARLGLAGVRLVGDAGRRVKKVALCGGSGMSLLRDAHRQGADVFVTGDVKYHEARDAEALGIALLDAGHFGTEAIMVSDVVERLTADLVLKGFEADVVAFNGERDPFVWR